MMNCKQAVARLQTFLDRELSEAEIGEVRIHLDACPPCLNHFQFEEGLKRLIMTRCLTNEAPSSLRARISKSFD